MTDDALFEFLYDWINQVLNTEPSPPPDPSIEIIDANDDGTLPTTNYITIQKYPSRNKIGRANSGDPDDNGDRNLVNDYELTIELREVLGGTNNLRKIIDSTDRQDIIDLFNANNLVYFGEGPITPVPTIQESTWRQESFVELRLGLAEETLESTSYIGNVEYTGTIPAQGRSGNHSVTNT